ncbi:TRAP transporter substrate-binding protein [Pararhodobacter sp.]|uniref:TRAP transporter substrate-binding protein n=1 Tax=Pararhodobacter sp. TaxID=2127056 RepID=UPI002FDF3716
MRIKTLKRGVAAVALGMMAGAAAAQEVNLRMISGWDDRFDGTVAIATAFGACVAEQSAGRIAVTQSGPEVIPPNQQFDPVSRGIFDLGFTTPIYFLGTTGVPSAFFALPPDSELWRERGYWAFADEEMQRFGQRLVAFTAGTGDSDFYQIVMRQPVVEGDRPLDGLKIRGNNYYAPLVVPLGGSLVNVPGGEIYSALERGVVDGAAYPIAGMQRLGMHEVTGYMLRPRFGNSPFLITMNEARFDGLSAEDQQVILECGHRIEGSSTAELSRLSEETIAALLELGMQETALPEAIAARVNADLAAGSWQTALDGNAQSAERVEALRAMARQHGDAE